MRIGLDIDSTLHHYWDLFSTVARGRFGIDLPYEGQRDWMIGVLKPDQVRAIVSETHSEENILSADPYPGAVETVRRWSADGHWIHVTSHRSDESHEATERWLNQIGLPFDDLHCSFDKIPRCVELEVDVLVDDSPVNIAKAIEAGIVPATLEHPWNQEICAVEGVISASDWHGLSAALEPVLAPRRQPAG